MSSCNVSLMTSLHYILFNKYLATEFSDCLPLPGSSKLHQYPLVEVKSICFIHVNQTPLHLMILLMDEVVSVSHALKLNTMQLETHGGNHRCLMANDVQN